MQSKTEYKIVISSNFGSIQKLIYQLHGKSADFTFKDKKQSNSIHNKSVLLTALCAYKVHKSVSSGQRGKRASYAYLSYTGNFFQMNVYVNDCCPGANLSCTQAIYISFPS